LHPFAIQCKSYKESAIKLNLCSSYIITWYLFVLFVVKDFMWRDRHKTGEELVSVDFLLCLVDGALSSLSHIVEDQQIYRSFHTNLASIQLGDQIFVKIIEIIKIKS